MKKKSYLVVLSALLCLSACGSEKGDTCTEAVTSSSSFTKFSSVCELVEVTCGGGQILTHISNSTARVGGTVVTTHKFMDGSGASVEILEECGSACLSGDESISAGGCRLEDLIQGEAFVAFDADPKSPYPKYLAEVFRTDLVPGAVTNSFGDVTDFTNLTDVQARWSAQRSAVSAECTVPNDWCPDDYAIYSS